ncbi:hypothetical protein TNCT_455491 [Trichonephila clavata]|uniref:Uncharacterized protein n=1 Tax=Trichonephila clavata TaxID=2740835 RepID=A0A8X6JND8_TRICU|nr:hypothetical protein TNCT_455491 [Trichonephila clavata]
MLSQIGFFAHTHGFFCEGVYYPVEAAMVHIESESSFLITIDANEINFTERDIKCNDRLTKDTHQIPFPFIGALPIEKARAFINQKYHEKDLGKGCLVACKDAEQEFFFKSCEIPVININSIFSKDKPRLGILLPQYLYPFPDCSIHINGKCEMCCRRIAFVFAKFIKEKNEEELWENEKKLIQHDDVPIIESFEPYKSLIEINLKKAIENKQNVKIEFNGTNLNLNFSAIQ